ncbi:SNF2-related protein, partial [Erythrobacter sp. YJ-T3-07]|uniref:SNF2-related protein n=1 Tax=Erythrobacter sp. YJ-T3-07 TaxID=2793063 RepID=UPI0034D1C6C0
MRPLKHVILSYSTDLTSSRFINRITNAHQYDEPQQFYGGIVADPMGLGKTLTMIALVATDMHSDHMRNAIQTVRLGELRNVEATLIVVPPPCALAFSCLSP